MASVTTDHPVPGADRFLGQYRLLADNMHDLAFFVDGNGKIVEVNAAAARAYGAPAEELVGMPVTDLCQRGDGCAIQQTLASGEPRTCECVHRCRDGTLLPVEVNAVRADAGGEPFVLCLAGDLSHRHRRDLIHLQRVALEAAANAIVITDANGVIEWVNPAFTTLTGWKAEEAIGDTPRILRSGNHSRAFYSRMWQQLKSGEVWRGEMYNRRKDGTLYPEEQTITPVRDEKGQIAHFVSIKQDISDRKLQEEQIRFLALHDPLTALPNRRAFEATLARFAHDARAGRDAAILVLDIDEFKLVNDSAGHPVGDQLLVEITSLLQTQLRPGDFLARLGGDEFVVLVQNVSGSLAHDIAERLRRAVELLSFEHERIAYPVTISVGIAPISSGEDPKTIVSHADSAMYAAKERGKNRVATYPVEGGSAFHEVTRWLARMRAALRDGGFHLTFQPVIQLGSGTAVHFEALIRMRAEDGSTYLPEQFLPCAERYGLMPQIDRWVFDEVVRILESEPDIRIFANLSGRSLSDEPLLRHIEECLRSSTIAPGRLSFEITETAAVADLASARNWVRRLKDLGCLIALDDFGVGFSSFGYLRALDVDYVKIDRTFVHDLDTNATNRALVQAVNTVARTLGKEVIAEGVESEAHADVLRDMGIDHGQGFHWGVPVALSEVLLSLAARTTAQTT